MNLLKKIQLKEQKDSLFEILNIRNNQLFNNVNHNLNIDDVTKQKNNPLLSVLNVPFTSHTMSKMLCGIVKLSKEFPDSCIMNIKHPQGSTSKIISIPK